MSDKNNRAPMLAGVSDDDLAGMSRGTGIFVRADDAALNTNHLLGLAKKRAQDPTIFDEREPWFGRFVATTYTIDSYFTRADKDTTMKNYQADLNEGRALLVGHETRGQINLGMSLVGKYEAHGYTHREEGASDSQQLPWVYGDFYLLRGKEPQDSVIDAFRGGTQDRFSVGFSPGWWRCSVDRMDLFSWDCPHIPGRYYSKDGKPVEDRSQGTMAFADLVDCHLRELSTVYSNSTPGATLLKAQRMVESGAIHDFKTVRFLESLYRHRMPGSEHIYPAATPEREASPVTDEAKEAAGGNEPGGASAERAAPVINTDNVLMIDRAELEALGLARDATASTVLEAFKLHRKGAAQVETYRAAAIKEAIDAGGRALGVNFSKERQTKMLEALDVEDIIAQRQEWVKVGDATFKAGRQTVEKPSTAARTPAAANRRTAPTGPTAPIGAYGA